MKFYWRGRDGKAPPPNARFFTCPFLGTTSLLNGTLVDLPEPATARVIKKTLLPNKDDWMRGVERALGAIRRKELKKVVLARRCVLELDHAPNPFALTASLQGEGAFVFCIQNEKEAFFGASPERLFMRKKNQLFSEALAGTRPIAAAPEELLHSKKDLHEFSLVKEHLTAILSPLCTKAPYFTPLSIHKTQNVQHLYQQCTAPLQENVSDETILTKLHPTPALCGAPKEAALTLMRECEPFERGLYGGVIGWQTAEASEWIVAIRSCHLKGNIATLFSGTGIVEGSDPEKEWEELDSKLRLYDRILVD